MQRIRYGLLRYQNNVFPNYRAQYEELSLGQNPSTLFITCSDSRIVPHIITQTQPGELFIVRTAGNFVPTFTSAPSGEAATIEYAVKVLNVREIVVCGHSHCGALSAMLKPESVKNLPAVKHWLAHGQEALNELDNYRAANPSQRDLLTSLIECNVKVQLEHLRTYPYICAAEDRGQLTLHGCFYRFETGEAFELDEAAQHFVSVAHGCDYSQSIEFDLLGS